ncbi:MAG: LysR family transcriptional regulator [Pseudomonadota bacterium]
MKRTRFDIRDWEAFAVLERVRHFGQAADELGITQSAVSQRISKLETDLDLKLLSRSNRGVEPTEAGRALQPYACALLAARRNALEAAAAIRANGARPARLLLSNAVVHTAVLPTLRQALEETLHGRFDVDVEPADIVETRLLSGVCDLAVTTLPVTRDGVEQSVLTRLPMGVAVPADATHDQISMKELCRNPLLVVPRSIEPHLFDGLVVAAAKAGQSLRIERSIVAFPSILAMVAMGKGWGIVPLAMTDATPNGVRIVPLALPEPPTIRVLAAWRSENTTAVRLAESLHAVEWELD